MNYASPFWQEVLFGLAAVYLLFEVWRGWRKGVIRMALSLLALAGSSVAFFIVNQMAAALLGNILPVPAMVAGAFFGLMAAIAVYIIIWFMSALLFKRTEHHNSAIVRFFFGVGGAVLGVVFWAVIVVSLISCVRLLGTFSEASLTGHANGGNNPVQAMTSGLATLKQSMEIGETGKAVQSLDVIPAQAYDLVTKIGKLSSDGNAAARFVQYPGTQELMNDPAFAALSNNPVIASAIQNQNYLSLLQNKDILAALNNPALLSKLEKFDLAKALDYALAKPGQTNDKSTPNPYQ